MAENEKKATENRNINRLIGERIKAARKRKDPSMNQGKLAEQLGVTFQAVSNWETGRYIPDSDHLPALAKELDLSLDSIFAEDEHPWELKPVNFNDEHMFTFVKGRAQLLDMPQTLEVLAMIPRVHKAHDDDDDDETKWRKSRYGFKAPYAVHPLALACHALAMGLKDDDIIAACLAHDMVEDSDLKPEDLPANDRVKEAVRLVTKPTEKEKEKDPDWEKKYYDNIRKNPLACLIKCLDRCNNLSCMADGFSRKKMAEYTAETDRYYPELLEVIKKQKDWNDAWWLLRYQMTALEETFKRLL